MPKILHLLRRLLERLVPGETPRRPPDAPPAPPFMLGVNLCGAEFGTNVPGEYGRDYTYPTESELDYYNAKGLRLIRLPFRWERIQPVLFGAPDEVELGRLAGFVEQVGRRGMKVIPEPHNFARYRGQVVGTPAVPKSALADLWQRLAGRFKCDPAIYALGLMNEPHDTAGRWPAAAQAAVDAIRSVDPATWILVPGDQWTGAADWRKDNERLWIDDPSHRLLYEVHLYFDRDRSGRYARTYDQDGASPMIGVHRLAGFLDWLAERNAVGMVGEFGVPAGPQEDPRWLDALDVFARHLREIGMTGCYWAGGPWWGADDRLTIEPRDGRDRPQMAILEKYTTPGDY